jgi:antitoxin component YwqK of YwqJK toxin-antitoxin module
MSTLTINEKNLTMIGFDGGGSPIWHYKNKPFTGLLVCYEDDGTKAYEKECKDGYEEGWHRSYYPNGQMDEEYKQHNNEVVPKTYKRWDEDGNLLEDWGA